MKREEILSNLEFDISDIVLLDSVSSTNDYLKKLALNGAKDSTIVIAKSQTKGKGYIRLRSGHQQPSTPVEEQDLQQGT